MNVKVARSKASHDFRTLLTLPNLLLGFYFFQKVEKKLQYYPSPTTPRPDMYLIRLYCYYLKLFRMYMLHALISHPWIGFCIWVVSYVPLGSLDALVQGMEGGKEGRQRQWSFSSGGSGHNPAPNSPHR